MMNNAKREYKVIRAFSTEKLTSLIHKAYEEGYSLYHGLTVSEGWLCTKYYQIVTKTHHPLMAANHLIPKPVK